MPADSVSVSESIGAPADPLDLALAARLVREAGALAARMLAAGLKTEHKTSITDVVSAADRDAETLIAGQLIDERPTDGIVGEEGAARTGSGVRTWYIDPVDGTFNFLSGLPYWCSAIGLVDGNGPVLGAIYHPAVDELWLGGRGVPTSCNGGPVPSLRQAPPYAHTALASYLNPARVADAELRAIWLRAVAGAGALRMLGSGSIELASIAGGRLGAWLHLDTSDWDWYPGAALVLAAGGAAERLELNGRCWHLAGPAGSVAELRAALIAR